jgi:hypothetical protein
LIIVDPTAKTFTLGQEITFDNLRFIGDASGALRHVLDITTNVIILSSSVCFTMMHWGNLG